MDDARARNALTREGAEPEPAAEGTAGEASPAEARGRAAGPAPIVPPEPPRDPLAESLALLARLLERPVSPTALTAGLPLVEGRLTPALGVRAAARAGLAARLVRRSLVDLSEMLVPCVILLAGGEACVLLGRAADGRYRVALPDAGGGESLIEAGRLEARYLGHALVARPRVGADPHDRQLIEDTGGHWFWSVLLRQWPVYSEVALAALLINLFALASPLFIMNVYDRVVPNQAIETLWVLAIGVVTVFGFDFLLRTLRGYFVDAAGKVADIRLASRIFEHVLGIRMASRPGSSGVFANHLREFESLRDFFASASITALIDLPFIFFFIAIIWLIGGPVAIVPAVAVPLVLAIGLLVQLPLNRVVRRTFAEAAQKHGILVEAINGLETVKATGAEGRVQRDWERYVAAAATSGARARLLSAITINSAALAANMTTAGVMVVGVYLIAEGRLTVGALVACTIIAGRTMAPLGQVAGVLARFHQARTAYETLSRVMRLPTERPPEKRFVHRPVLDGAIEFKQVTFTYPGQKQAALDGVSFRIAPGEKVGLIGRVGSGKTTVEKLILGLYEPQQGAVLVDGIDIRQIDPADLRRNIGAVLQDVCLFRGTLRDNITLGASFADDAAVIRAARFAGVEGFANRHPLGYDMPIGERGEALSGGQRQAVALARALLLDPPLLLLDEPTSAMDTLAEEEIKKRLAHVLRGKTLLLVTHRGSLLSLVDRLIVMDAGRVVADGPREKVLDALAKGRIRRAS